MTSRIDPTDTADTADGAPPLEAPAPPDVAGLVNLRDVGGLRTQDGRRTRAGVLYRSEMPKEGDHPPASLAWPPPTVIDLRSAAERGPHAHPLAALGSTVRVFPLLGEDAGAGQHSATSAAMTGGLRSLYEAMLQHAAPQIAEIVEVAAAAPGPILVHCAAGKDRTGVTVAVLLRLADVLEADVLADYLATEANMPGVLRRLRGHALLPGGGSQDVDKELVRVSPVAAEAVLATTSAHPGGVAGWLRGHGTSDEAIRRWRERIIG
ncbi:putative Tyrosine specific protein phosphatase [Frankia canadensis]|uniref:Putative Tyrosine specific protein phosphatase n=1 Tax=Frankia canadensis TaxID=1836972 RepID=A0A2I2KMJ7_9ACTN|nr:tyrosine-protein phosphatase [Frankia canadensis]SNQ46888.1 putative Tyrosine specific protein phosphatase [Frankia canadensis]SOU54178.1 putative Tyrosine specific protein phosphatase [Frankia canadensis]